MEEQKEVLKYLETYEKKKWDINLNLNERLKKIDPHAHSQESRRRSRTHKWRLEIS